MKNYLFTSEVEALFKELDAIAPENNVCKKKCKDNYTFCKNSCWDHKPDLP
jgi:hypothetical protein